MGRTPLEPLCLFESVLTTTARLGPQFVSYKRCFLDSGKYTTSSSGSSEKEALAHIFVHACWRTSTRNLSMAFRNLSTSLIEVDRCSWQLTARTGNPFHCPILVYQCALNAHEQFKHSPRRQSAHRFPTRIVYRQACRWTIQ